MSNLLYAYNGRTLDERREGNMLLMFGVLIIMVAALMEYLIYRNLLAGN